MGTLLRDGTVAIAAVMVLVVSVGMYVYNSASSSIYSTMNEIEDTEYKVIDTSENDVFNAQFETYVGEITGSDVRNLISVLITNANIYAEFDDRLPDLFYEATRGNALVITSTEGNTNVDDFYTAKEQIEIGHDYYVSIEYSDETGFVEKIKISYDRPIYGE